VETVRDTRKEVRLVASKKSRGVGGMSGERDKGVGEMPTEGRLGQSIKRRRIMD